jgi:hypothetical protein
MLGEVLCISLVFALLQKHLRDIVEVKRLLADPSSFLSVIVSLFTHEKKWFEGFFHHNLLDFGLIKVFAARRMRVNLKVLQNKMDFAVR